MLRVWPSAGRTGVLSLHSKPGDRRPHGVDEPRSVDHVKGRWCMYRVSQNYPNMHFSTIISTALKPLKMWIPKFSEILIKRQS